MENDDYNALGVIKCPGCQNDIDPTCCSCGNPRDYHPAWDHQFVPIGCTCYYADKSLAPEAPPKEKYFETDWDLS